MLEEIVEAAWGPWGIAAVLVLGTQTGRNVGRKALRTVVKGGLMAGDAIKSVAASAQESTADLVAEARAELNGGAEEHKHVHQSSSKGKGTKS